MRQIDRAQFGQIFRGLYSTLGGYRQSEADMDAKITGYFNAFEHLTLQEVTEKAETWLRTETTFPKPVEWANIAIKRQAPPLAEMSPERAQEQIEAEKMGYEGPPCDCERCINAEIYESPVRFVPEYVDTPSGEPKDKILLCPIRKKAVAVGHWAHGHELARWYEAHNAYTQMCRELKFRDPLTTRPRKGLTRIGE